MKIQYNNELSIIDTEVKAYFLGLLYADGCVCKKAITQKHIRISLTDKELIDKLYLEFPFFNYEIWDFGKYNKNSKIQYGLRKTSTKLYNDLVKNGLLERKSLNNKEFVNIANIEKTLLPHFLRGYFDGDGSISIAKSRPNLRRAEICSVSENFLLQIERIFRDNNILNKDIRAKQPGINAKSILYVMEWINSDSILKLKEFLYKNATIYLERKKEKFDSFKIVHIRENNPDCILCKKSGVCTKLTSRQMKYGLALRYKCHNCNKMFTIPQTAQLKSEELLENQEIDNQQPSL